jgi:bacterioferritin (cytochrome b1)
MPYKDPEKRREASRRWYLRNQKEQVRRVMARSKRIRGEVYKHKEENPCTEFLTSAAAGEMQHVQAFLDRLIGVDAKPAHISGKLFAQHTDPKKILSAAVDLEEEVVKNYADRLEQLESLPSTSKIFASYFTIFYEDQLQDSYEDCEKIRNLLRS